MKTVSSIASLVVPGIFDTIAFSSLSREFKREDLPAFGLPAIDTGTPFLIAFPNLKLSFNNINFFSTLSTSLIRSFFY